jgi:hypothetical protein
VLCIRNVQENHEKLELNSINQVFIYAHAVNLLGDNTSTIKNNTNLLRVSKGTGLK